ncbi:Galactose oxidase protein [Rutstroemia sp. NJR-2017a WRK4]|nr:Galactose oxidase protein [Rutstroemia sp. NJR-2017a WRK4]
MKSTIILSAFAVAASASPFLKPRSLDISAYKAVPTIPVTGAPAGNTATPTVLYNPATAAAVVTSDATASPIAKRKTKRTTCPAACPANPAGNGPAISSPDTPAAFHSSSVFADAALNAATPESYALVDGFKNVEASAQDATYLTYISDALTSYNPAICANACNNIQGCTSFNIYFERDPTVVPNEDDCPNPASQTLIKCALFGGVLSASSATNVGQWQADFNVVIAGSNAYNAIAPPTLSGYGTPQSFGTATIDAPANTTTYMGEESFSQAQPYDPSLCAATCSAKHSPECAFFVSYILYENGQNGVFTCTYFTVSYGPEQAIEKGQYDEQGNHYTIGHSFGYTVL